jgi:hypothetical protein
LGALKRRARGASSDGDGGDENAAPLLLSSLFHFVGALTAAGDVELLAAHNDDILAAGFGKGLGCGKAGGVRRTSLPNFLRQRKKHRAATTANNKAYAPEEELLGHNAAQPPEEVAAPVDDDLLLEHFWREPARARTRGEGRKREEGEAKGRGKFCAISVLVGDFSRPKQPRGDGDRAGVWRECMAA